MNLNDMKLFETNNLHDAVCIVENAILGKALTSDCTGKYVWHTDDLEAR